MKDGLTLEKVQAAIKLLKSDSLPPDNGRWLIGTGWQFRNDYDKFVRDLADLFSMDDAKTYCVEGIGVKVTCREIPRELGAEPKAVT